MHSSSFKNISQDPNKKKNDPCLDDDSEWDGLRKAHDELQTNELGRVEKIINSSPALATIIFTHVPYLDDPYRVDNCQKYLSSWYLTDAAKKVWDRIIKIGPPSNPSVKAIFAGHFHDSHPSRYLQPYSWQKSKDRNPQVEAITYLAPPLSAKFQIDKSPQARGLGVATVTSKGEIKSEIHWFNTFPAVVLAASDVTGNDSSTPSLCVVIVASIFGVDLVFFFWLRHRQKYSAASLPMTKP